MALSRGDPWRLAGPKQRGAVIGCDSVRIVAGLGGSRRIALGLAAGLLAALPHVAEAQGTRYLDPVFSGVTVTNDLTYGAAVNNVGATQSLELDVYEPAGDSLAARPVVIWAHGGGFKTGNKRDVAAFASGFAQRGFVAVAVEYRLRPSGTPGAMTNQELLLASLQGQPEPVRDAQHDMQAAVRWVRAHAAELRVDPDAITAAGNSAGAITALETAFNPSDPGTSGTPDVASTVAAAVSVSGASDLRRIEPGAPPILMFHGTNDTTVPFALGAATCAATIARANACEPVVWPGEGHGVAGAHREEILETASAFLCRRVIAGCADA